VNRPEMKALLAGMGNPLSGDDGFGPRVLDQLRLAGMHNLPGISLLNAFTDLLNHIESFVEYDRVVLIDSILDPERRMGTPGMVGVLGEQSLLSLPEASQGVHQMSPVLGVKLFRTLHPAARTTIQLVGLFVDRISHSPLYLTEERIHEAVNVIRALLKN
jgi:hydrogenase maturation protease